MNQSEIKIVTTWTNQSTVLTYLSSGHHETPVHSPGDVILVITAGVSAVSVKEWRPAWARVKLVLTGEQLSVAADTVVHPSLMVIIILPSPGPLCSVLPCHLEHQPISLLHSLYHLYHHHQASPPNLTWYWTLLNNCLHSASLILFGVCLALSSNPDSAPAPANQSESSNVAISTNQGPESYQEEAHCDCVLISGFLPCSLLHIQQFQHLTTSMLAPGAACSSANDSKTLSTWSNILSTVHHSWLLSSSSWHLVLDNSCLSISISLACWAISCSCLVICEVWSLMVSLIMFISRSLASTTRSLSEKICSSMCRAVGLSDGAGLVRDQIHSEISSYGQSTLSMMLLKIYK